MQHIQNISQTPRSYWPAPFFAIWSGQALAMVTSETVQFALIWWLTTSSKSATVVSIATMIALLPRALLSPAIGALVDRWNRRLVLIASHIMIILSMLCLGLLFRTGNASIRAIYLIILACACAKSFQMPAMLASTTLMVPQKHLSRIAGLNQMLQGVMRVLAPALGAVLVHALPMHAIVVVDIAGAFLALVALLLIAMPNPPVITHVKTSIAGWQSLWKDILAGVRLVRNWRGAIEMLFISTTVNFLSTPAFMLTSILVTQHFNGAEREFGLIGAAIGAGMISGGMVLSLWGGFRRPMQTSLLGVTGLAVALLVTGLAPSAAFWMAIGGMFLGGFMIPVCMAPIQALVQQTVAPAMQGRVLTLLDSISTAISPLSLVIAGPLFDQFGPQAWYVAGSVLILLTGILGFATPRVMNLGESQPAMDDRALAS